MENFMGLKLKRKQFDDSNDEIFADICLSSPASKIRRLDADLPPTIEQDGAGIPLKYEQSIPEGGVSSGVTEQLNPIDIEELPFVPDNNEKAIVLFKPMDKPFFYSPNNFSIDPNLISSFKNHALLHTQRDTLRTGEEEEAERNGDNGELNACKAIIPWEASQPLYQRPILASQTKVSGSMEGEDMDATMMDIEEDNGASNVGQQEVSEYINHSRISEGLQHQHCMIPQPPQNTTTPIVWYR